MGAKTSSVEEEPSQARGGYRWRCWPLSPGHNREESEGVSADTND